MEHQRLRFVMKAGVLDWMKQTMGMVLQLFIFNGVPIDLRKITQCMNAQLTLTAMKWQLFQETEITKLFPMTFSMFCSVLSLLNKQSKKHKNTVFDYLLSIRFSAYLSQSLRFFLNFLCCVEIKF